jgi:hypothetical protein
MRVLVALTVALAALVLSAPAHALDVAVQDQGAAPADLQRVADGLGARTVRIIVAPGEPRLELVRQARLMGRQVQAAVLVKRTTTAGDVRALMRAWHGQVRTVSIGNEPELNGVPACFYARLVRSSSLLIRREFPGTRIGLGEFSPVGAREYLAKMLRCGVRLSVDFVATHPYSFVSDPLAAPTELTGVPGASWLGIGNLSSLVRQVRRARPVLRVRERLPRCTEFAYLTTGRYKISEARAAWAWPRAIRQARKWCGQLVIYGTGPVHDGSSWGSAGLLDAFGRVSPILRALAGALGKRFPDPEVPSHPAGDLETALPSGDVVRVPPLPAVAPVPAGEGASTDRVPEQQAPEPVVIVEPAPVEVLPDPPVVAPPAVTDPIE